MRHFRCRVVQYFYNLFVLSSKIVNTLTGGSPHNTLSMQLGNKEYKNKIEEFATMVINDVFWVLFKEVDHVENAVNGEAKAASIWLPYKG